MSDYVRANSSFFGDKDVLPTDNAAKVIVGAEFDDEFNDIATAVNTKYDSLDDDVANGIAALDANGIVADSVLPTATTTQIGVLETATAAELLTGVAADKIVTPDLFIGGVDTWGTSNAGMVSDIQALTDPGQNTLLGWDENVNAAIGFTLGTGVTTSGTAVVTDDANIDHDALDNFVSNEHINHGNVTLTAGDGLTGGGTIAASRTFDLDISSLTAADATDLTSTDGFLFDNGGVMSRMAYSDSGIRVATITGTTDTLATADMNSFLHYTNASAVTVTLNNGVGTVGNVIIIKQGGAGQVTISGTATIETVFGSNTRVEESVITLICTAANTWALYGDTGT